MARCVLHHARSKRRVETASFRRKNSRAVRTRRAHARALNGGVLRAASRPPFAREGAESAQPLLREKGKKTEKKVTWDSKSDQPVPRERSAAHLLHAFPSKPQILRRCRALWRSPRSPWPWWPASSPSPPQPTVRRVRRPSFHVFIRRSLFRRLRRTQRLLQRPPSLRPLALLSLFSACLIAPSFCAVSLCLPTRILSLGPPLAHSLPRPPRAPAPRHLFLHADLLLERSPFCTHAQLRSTLASA